MINRFFKKYLSIIFIISTFIGVFHHHDDLEQHNDCKICILQASIANADMPVDGVYIPNLDLFSEPIISPLQNLYVRQISSRLQARAPPKIS